MPSYSSGQALSMMGNFADETLPAGMSYEWTGLAYQEEQTGSQAYFIFALSITLVYLVLAAQYESWTDPIAVILVVPTALIGILLALVIRKFPVDLYTQIGLVLMIALAAKNAILIVEFARDLAAQGMGTAEAAVEATRRRFRPILMTSIAFILGVVPLVDRNRRRRRQPAVTRYRGLRRNARFNSSCDTLRARLLCLRPPYLRTAVSAGSSPRRPTPGASHTGALMA